jgi:hypothetical protein
MAAKRSMARVRIAVEVNVPNQEVTEGGQCRFVPVPGAEHCPEDLLQAAVLVTGQAVDPGIDVDRPNLG